MKSSFLCVIGICLLAQTQPFVVHNSMSLLFNNMYSGIQKLFHNMGHQIPGSFQPEQEDNYVPNNSGGEIYVTTRTTKAFTSSSHVLKTYAECSNRVKVNPDSIKWINKGYWKKLPFDKMKFDEVKFDKMMGYRIPEHELMVWVHCVLVQSGLMTNQSVFRQDVAFKNVSNFERPILEAKIDKCLPTSAMEPLDISWHFAKCYQRVNPAKSLF